jgi:septal ring factor EnvC (AmiA/AmiB activator)
MFLLGGGVLLMHAKKLSDAVLRQTAKDWQDLATSRLEVITNSQNQLNAIQLQITGQNERIALLERDKREIEDQRDRLQRRVERLIRTVAALVEQLEEAGMEVAPELRRDLA